VDWQATTNSRHALEQFLGHLKARAQCLATTTDRHYEQFASRMQSPFEGFGLAA
jgi:hypothetical protein